MNEKIYLGIVWKSQALNDFYMNHQIKMILILNITKERRILTEILNTTVAECCFSNRPSGEEDKPVRVCRRRMHNI